MIQTTNPLCVRLFINMNHPDPTKRNGWSERIPIYEDNFERGLLICAALRDARRNILCKNAVLEWATLAQLEYPWHEQAVIGPAPLQPLPQWDINLADAQGLWWNYDAQNGYMIGHLFRAIDRNEFGQMRWRRGRFVLPPGIETLPSNLNAASTEQLLNNCFQTFRAYYGVLRTIGERVDGVQHYEIHKPWEARYIRTSARIVGRANIRLSWEAVPWINAPPFSPCGTVTGVGRNSFAVQCRFYPGGPVGWIHYYRAAPDTAVFPLRHIFWGRFRDEDLYNSYGVGELSGTARRWWTPGPEYGVAPGTEFEGPIAGFTGEYVPTWAPTYPTPPELRPACDNPNSKNTLVGYGGLCVGGSGIGWSKVA